MNLVFLLLAIALLISTVSPSGYVKDQIFERLATVSSNCIRLLNGTGTVGCQSNLKGNIGALVKISMPNDVQEAIKKLPLGINDLIVLVEMRDLHRELIDEIRTNEQVQGIILLNENDEEKRPAKFSEDSACPNRQFSIYKNAPTCHEWNAEAAIHPDGLKFLAFEKPIRFVQNRTEIDILVNKCANPYNKEMKADGFRCMGRMTAFMLAAGNAQLCMDRSQSSYGITGNQILCEPLSEWNVFSMLPPLGQKSNKTVRADQFVLAARMDTFSTDYNARNGDFSVLTSIIALLSIAQAIGSKMSEFLDLARQRQLLFAFFHGESLGHIGSSRWLWDMERGEFPHPPMKLPEEQIRQIGLDALSFFFELQQIGTGEQLFFHTDLSVYVSNRTQINQLVAPFKDRVQFVDPNQIEYGSLPPGSFHSVLARTSHVPGMVLSSFGKGNYTNNYLNSLFDMEIRENPKKLNSNVQRIAMAADVGLKAALQYVFNTTDSEKIDKFQIDIHYVETLADCFFNHSRWECPLISGVVNATNDAKMRRWLKYTANDLYVGTAGHHFSSIRVVLYSLLVNSLGQTGPTVNVATAQQCKDQNKKQNVYTYVWQNDPETNTPKCYRTSIYMGQAQSPAFQIKNYDFANSIYSTWMESIQRTAGTMELYLKADYHLELYALLLVLLVILVSAPLSYGLKEQWFIDNTLPPASPQQL